MKFRIRRSLAVLGGLAVVASLGLAPAAQAASAPPAAAHGTYSPGIGSLPDKIGPLLTNSHWSGYDATTGTYTSVAATFIQPTVNCSKGGDVVFWVGLGGGVAGSNSLQQNGTFAQCEGGTAVYAAWWEMYPCNSITEYGSTVRPGDKIVMKTINEGSNKYEFYTQDVTEGWTAAPTHTGCNGGSTQTAEVITETPGVSGGLANLANFGKVTYTSATINGKALSAAKPSKVTMARSGVTMCTTSAIGTGGETFSNSYKASS